jgi:CRISPR-associated exonuclease Cas4
MIRVSDIVVYHKCPRKCYFTIKGHELIKDINAEYTERMILKELAFVYEHAFKNEDMFSFLNSELDRISGEIRIIYPSELSGIDDDGLAMSVSNVRSCLGNICSNLSLEADFYTGASVYVEPLLRSERFGLTGSPDKLVKINDEFIPSMIKTGNMPETGIWQSDRLQLTAYAMLAGEKYDTAVERGFVEYARWGKVREAVIKRHERRKILQIRDKIRKIEEGFMPEKPADAPCEHCGFTGLCDVKSTLASRFF